MKNTTISSSFVALCLVLLFLSSCMSLKPTPEKQQAIYTPTTFAELPGWQHESFDSVKQALSRSCALMAKRDPNAPVNPTAVAGKVADWQPACKALETVQPTEMRAYFETYFTPHRVTNGGTQTGLFTGYYEKQLTGSLTKTSRYTVPLYKRPPELVMVELGDFRPELKGQRIAGKVIEGKLKPFASRADIDNGSLAGRGLELAWVDDADAAFFLHIQGSGRVALEDGTTLRVGYDGQNGHVYQAIGRTLIQRGELTPENTSMQKIKQWLVAHPQQAAALRQENPSYIFFREIVGDGPIGAQNVALTPQRSLAVDPNFIPYGAPIWLSATRPTHQNSAIRRLLIAQDTGGAIRGAVRGDYFWGAGEQAEEQAGVMRSRGAYWLLLPKSITGLKTQQ